MSGSWPKAYSVGTQDFFGRDFMVSPEVLIPRPETEMLIDMVLNLAGVAFLPGVKPNLAKIPRKAKIWDIGTGSGCIAVTLALELPEIEASACDCSEKALAVARKNAEKLRAKVRFLRSDLLAAMTGDFDVIVANLPYVDENWGWLDKKALSAEPELALYAEDGGLALIKRLIDEASAYACSEKMAPKERFLALEADPCQHEAIKKYASEQGWRHIETRGFAILFVIGG